MYLLVNLNAVSMGILSPKYTQSVVTNLKFTPLPFLNISVSKQTSVYAPASSIFEVHLRTNFTHQHVNSNVESI